MVSLPSNPSNSFKAAWKLTLSIVILMNPALPTFAPLLLVDRETQLRCKYRRSRWRAPTRSTAASSWPTEASPKTSCLVAMIDVHAIGDIVVGTEPVESLGQSRHRPSMKSSPSTALKSFCNLEIVAAAPAYRSNSEPRTPCTPVKVSVPTLARRITGAAVVPDAPCPGTQDAKLTVTPAVAFRYASCVPLLPVMVSSPVHPLELVEVRPRAANRAHPGVAGGRHRLSAKALPRICSMETRVSAPTPLPLAVPAARLTVIGPVASV